MERMLQVKALSTRKQVLVSFRKYFLRVELSDNG